VKDRIEAALRRSAEIDGPGIQGDAKDSTIILRGKVRTWSERDEAERATRGAPGVLRATLGALLDPEQHPPLHEELPRIEYG
jgi:osmotically-inducible protein OsmY